MSPANFLKELANQGWNINLATIDIETSKIDSKAQERLLKAPKELRDLLTSFSECVNDSETIWMFSYSEYMEHKDSIANDIAFPWFFFEQESIENSNPEIHKNILHFWDNHVPFMMSVDGEYAFIAVCIDDVNYGKIYHGTEPEYEDVSLIASDLSDFFDKFLDLSISI